MTFDYSQFRKDAHFESPVFRGKLGLRGVQFKSVLFASNGRVLDQEQFSGPIDLKGAAYDSMEAKWDHLLERGEGGARIQPYDPQIYGTLEHALRGEGRDSQADDVYRFGREVEDAGLPLSSRVRYFVWGELLGYGTGYRAWVISLVVVLLGGIYFRFASKEGKLNLGKAMDRSLLEIFEDCSMRRSAGAQSVFVEDPTRRRLCPERFRPPPCSGGFIPPSFFFCSTRCATFAPQANNKSEAVRRD